MKKTICVSCDKAYEGEGRDYGVCESCEATRRHVIEKLRIGLDADTDLVVNHDRDVIHVRYGDFCVMVTIATPTKLVNCCDPDGKLD